VGWQNHAKQSLRLGVHKQILGTKVKRQVEEEPAMTKKNWQELLKRLEIDTALGSLQPVDPKDLDSFEAKRGVKLPRSYRKYCEVFGAGEFGRQFKIAVPGYQGPAAEVFSLDELNQMAIEGQEYDVYSKDAEQHKRGIFFCLDILGSFHFFDPAEVTDRVRHEYAIYTVFRDFELKRIADNFWEFITAVCLSKRHSKLVRISPPQQLFMPINM
jgi:hypothetical protein